MLKYIFNKIVSIIDFLDKRKILIFFKNKIYNKITLIDVGAHKGETIKFFSYNFDIKKIYAFEPNKNIFKILKKKKFPKTKLYNFSLGNKNEVKPLNVYEDSLSSSYNDLNKESLYFKRKVKLSFDKYCSNKIDTNIITLNNFLKKEKINKINILKIDTEGYEYNVIKGINKKNFKLIDFIYFEHHYNKMISKNYKFADIHKILIKNNFTQKLKIKMTLRKTFEYIYRNIKFDEDKRNNY